MRLRPAGPGARRPLVVVGDLHHTFATHVDRTVANNAHDLAPIGVVLALAGICVLVWCASDPESARVRASRGQAPKRSLRGSSV